jgi:hypothetical protein
MYGVGVLLLIEETALPSVTAGVSYCEMLGVCLDKA